MALLESVIHGAGLTAVMAWLQSSPPPIPVLAQPGWLLLLLVPLLIGLLQWRRRQRLLDYAEPHLRRWALVGMASSGERRWRKAAWAGFWLLLVLALADPQVPKPSAEALHAPAPVMLVLDVSEAMTVQDVSPDRAARARALVDQLVNRLPGVPLGLMVYADRAGLLLPPTTDRGLLRYFVRQSAGLTTQTDAPRPDKAFARLSRMPSMAHGAVVWLTSADARSFAGPVGTRQLEAAQQLAKRHIPVYALIEAGRGGVMREDGMPLTDIQGNAQRSEPKPSRVAELARLTGGDSRVTTTLPADADYLAGRIRRLPPLPPSQSLGDHRVSIHQLPLLLAALLLIVLLLAESLRRREGGVRGTSRQAAAWVAWPLAGLLALSLGGLPSRTAQAAEASTSKVSGASEVSGAVANRAAIQAGKSALAAGDYAQAQIDFGPAKGFAARFGSGVSAYRRGDYAFAVGQLQEALWLARDKTSRHLALFNLGDALVLVGRYQAALDAFDAILADQPDNAAAKKNRQIVASLLDKKARNRKDEPRYEGHRNAIYGYYHEPEHSKMDDRMLKSHGAAGGQTGGRAPAAPAKAFHLTPELAGSARRKLDLIHDRPAPLLRALIDQQLYSLPSAGGGKP